MSRLVGMFWVLVALGCDPSGGVSADGGFGDVHSDAVVEVVGQSCTPSGLFCGEDEICARGGRCDGPGRCVPRPNTCPSGVASDLVCGCDGETYASVCEANSNDVDTAFDDSTCDMQ